MTPRDVVLVLAAVAVVVGFALAWPPLGLVALGGALFCLWFFLLDDVGGDE